MDFCSGIEMLLAAAETVTRDESDVNIDNISVARYEEVATHRSGPPSNSFDLSFAAVRTSTPMKAVEDPRCSVPMDLSQTVLEDTPLNLSMRETDTDVESGPLNLVLDKAPESSAKAASNSGCPLNLKKPTSMAAHENSPTCSVESPNKVPGSENEQNASDSSAVPKAIAPFRDVSIHTMTECAQHDVDRLASGDPSLYLTPSEILGKPHRLQGSAAGSAVEALTETDSAEQSIKGRSRSCENLSPSKDDENHPRMTTTRACGSSGSSTAQLNKNECDRGSDDDDDDIEIGNATFLNHYSIREYFEPYLNASIIGFGEEEADKENFDSKGEPSQGTSDKRKRKSNEALADTELKSNITSSDDDFDDVALEELQNNKVLKNANPKLLNKFYKQRGMAYTRYNGTKVPPRSCRDPCYCVKLQCDSKYDSEIRKTMLKSFLQLSTSAQNQFLANHITVAYTASSRVINSKRVYAYRYYLPGNGGMVRVCKTMFLSTFDIKEKKARCLTIKKIKGLGIVAEDARRDNSRKQIISADERKFIESHIESFPSYTSHYGRAKSSKMYLSGDLNISKMYDLYCIQCEGTAFSPVHYNTYRTIFRTYNLDFRKPKADTCGVCDKLNIQIQLARDDAELAQLRAEKKAHEKKGQVPYDTKNQDVEKARKHDGVCTVTFDLQKCLPTPHLSCGQAYYSRQLYTLNLTIFETHRGKNQAFCYLWDETKARRGAQEIGSCILHYVLHLLERAQSDGVPIRQLFLYSDRCSGQNLNFVMVMTFVYIHELLMSKGYEVTITHKFMFTDHSHMEVDSVHAAIERSKKRTQIDIEIPRDWAVFISQIRRRVPFNVIEQDLSDFLNLKMLEARYGRPKTNINGDVIKIREIMVFEYRPSHLGAVFL